MRALIMMKPVNHHNMLANDANIGYQLEGSLFVQYLNFIPDQEEGKLFKDKNMLLLLEQSYTHMQIDSAFQSSGKTRTPIGKRKRNVKKNSGQVSVAKEQTIFSFKHVHRSF